MIINSENSKSYKWGDNCTAWELLLSENVIIKEELMPPKTEEQLHFHEKTEQFFYILEGEANFIIDQKKVLVSKNEGLKIEIGQAHKIANKSSVELRFLVLSFPGNTDDRINLNS